MSARLFYLALYLVGMYLMVFSRGVLLAYRVAQLS